MQFSDFKKVMTKHVDKLFSDADVLFVTDANGDELWDTYLNSFPDGTNEIFRQRREYDCGCCKTFIRQFANVVAFVGGQPKSIWDFTTGDTTFQPVIDALNAQVKNAIITDRFFTKTARYGIPQNRELDASSNLITWEHFSVDLPKKFVTLSPKSIAEMKGEYRDQKNLFKRLMDEIPLEVIQTVLEIIAQGSLYKGNEWKDNLTDIANLHATYHKLPIDQRDNFCWIAPSKFGFRICTIRNTSIGALLIDLAEGKELNEAVRQYHFITAPENYQRAKPIYTASMVANAEKEFSEAGLLDSLGRRFATMDDISINNLLYASGVTKKQLNVFGEMAKEATVKVKDFDKVEEVRISDFIANVLSTNPTNIELLFENRHAANLVSLITAQVENSKPLTKWDNGFTWAYSGNITDSSMKENVIKAGGQVVGALRFSIQWNDKNNNRFDFDIHCVEPNRNHIYFPTRNTRQASSGMQDVDIIFPNGVAVENIIWTDKKKMPNGTYRMYVNNFSSNFSSDGFSAEIEFDGECYHFQYDRPLKGRENIEVAEVTLKNGVFTIEPKLNTSVSSNVSVNWGLQTNSFHAVDAIMYSPNFWEQQGIGNQHHFFMLKGCKNETNPNGFYNEFLNGELVKKYKHVLEALGSRMKVETTDNQLSGLGFSISQRNSVICRVTGQTKRVIKLIF